MFRSKTTFIVGAGASCEAQLPSGERLKELIGNAIDIRFNDFGREHTGDARIVRALQQKVADTTRDINPYLHKAWQIRDIVPHAALSIDNYLDAHQGDEELELCRKLGIAKCILDAEHGSLMRRTERHQEKFSMPGLKDTWYVQFLKLLTENVRSADLNTIFDNIAFVIFNYDRCIEQFLVQGIQDYYNVSRGRAVELVKRIPMFHPYGTVGSLPWVEEREKPQADFGDNERIDLLSIAGNIKTFSEQMDDEVALNLIRNHIAEAETLVFLGFAFHRQNLQLIKPPEPAFTKRIFATVMGVSDSDQEHIKSDLVETLQIEPDDDGNIVQMYRPDGTDAEIVFFNGSCNDLFRNYWRSLSGTA